MNMPKLSIIIPVYNGEKYLQNLIENVSKTTYQNIEVLLIDDGSTDQSYEICKNFAMLNSKIRVYRKKNGGVASARNLGVYYATGEYISFVDQDDEVSNDMYVRMLSRIIKDESQMVMCGTYRKTNENEIVFERFTDEVYEKVDIRNKLLFPMLFKGFNIYCNNEISIYPTIWKCVISKQFIMEENIKFINFVNYEDDLLALIQILLKAERVSTVSEILYYWTTNISSETYKSRYIEDLETKQKKLMGYISSVLKKSNVDDRVLQKYIYVLHSRNVLQLLDNLSALKKQSLKSKIRIIQVNPSINFIQMEKKKILPEKGYVRNRIILTLVIKKLLLSAYAINRVINFVRFFVVKHPHLEMLERKSKGDK